MESWLNFYRPHFHSQKEVEESVEACEKLRPLAPNHVAKIMMHQTQRLVSIADELPKLRPHQEPLQVLFLIMCAENIAKVHDGSSGEGKSRHYVQKFFANFLSQTDKDVLGCGFRDNTGVGLPAIGFSKAVDLLYGIRCDVVHEGNYTDFAFHDGCTPMVNTNPDVIAEIQFVEVRDIVVRGCINAIKDKLSQP
jgi:hypothetical protein